MFGLMGVARNSGQGAAFSPRDLFALGEQGAWYDPSDFSSMFQDSAGTTPVTAVEQPVGLILDKRLGLARGVELVPAPYWTGGHTLDGALQIPTNWTAYGSANMSASTVLPNSFQFTATAHLAGIMINEGLIGKFIEYRIRARKTAFVSGTPSLQLYSGVWTEIIPSSASIGVWYEAAIRVACTNVLIISNFGGAASWEIEYISAKELAGNHATQATAAARPVVSARKNLLLATETLATQNVTVLATSHVLSFTGTGTITLTGASTVGPLVGTGASDRVSLQFTPTAGTLTLTVSGSVTLAQLETGSAATRYQRVTTDTDYDTAGFPYYLKYDGVDDVLETTFPDLGTDVTIARSVPQVGTTILTGQTIGAGVWNDSTTNCGLVIINRALTAGETTALTAYLNAKAGV